jgi:Holliday junction resolvasome RuvABC endonuclease subunit
MSKRKRAELPAVDGTGPEGAVVIVALDISSTTIGVARLHDRTLVNSATLVLKGDLFGRISQVRAALADWLQVADVLAIEAPSLGTTPYSMIAQQRVVGIVLWIWMEAHPDAPIIEIPPVVAKVALTGSHQADKEAMIKCAAWLAPDRVFSEHAADAFGTGLAAFTKIDQARLLAREAA